MERFFPPYYNSRRPEPSGLPTTLTYGGVYFNVTLSSKDLGGDLTNLKNTTVVVIRQGFSTHAMVCSLYCLSDRSLMLYSSVRVWANDSYSWITRTPEIRTEAVPSTLASYPRTPPSLCQVPHVRSAAHGTFFVCAC